MESLYRKYRPQTFADVVGQQHVVGTLQRAVLEGRTSHAYLFCGPRGTGKTTMARLLAKALMCEQGPGQLPDGTCEQCRLIASGEHPDVYELDAASRTGVDNVREEIINRVSYAPVQGRFKVYIIDEVHMLTTAAFNALLKTLEEPPAHVVFVLCTTDPQKIPATILSRVQRFDFRPIGNEDISRHLAYVCEQEGFTYEDAALELVVRNARGGMRDALSSLEQLSVFGSGTITLEAAQDLLGAVGGAELEQVVGAMAARNVATLFAQVATLVDSGHDLLQFTRELAAHMRDVYVVSVAGTNPEILPAGCDPALLQAEAQAFGNADRLARILTLLGGVSREMGTAPNQRLVLEIAFTRIARPEEDLTLEALAERVAALEQELASIKANGVVPATAAPQAPVAPVSAPAPTQPKPAPAQPAPAPEPAPAQPSQPAQQPRPAQPARAAQTAPAPQQTTRREEPARPAAQPAPKPQPKRPAATTLDPGALQRTWRKVVSELTARIPSRGSLLSSAMATSDDGMELVVSLPKGSSFALKMLDRPDVRVIVEGVVTEYFGKRTLTFKEGIGSDLQIPPAARRQQAPQPAAQASARPYEPSSRQTYAPRSPQQVPSQQAPSQQRQSPAPYEQPQQAPAPYPMPWDEPQRQQPAPAPAPDDYDRVPYEELGGMSYGYEDEQPMPAPALEPAAPQSAPARPAPAPEPIQPPTFKAPRPNAPAPVSAPEPAPAPAPAQQPRQEAVAQEPIPGDNTPSDLPPDLAAILENAFEVFGSDIKVSRTQ
ncbi:MAG: DNA polymerase III subunit gamma/tau [Coriobacteriales bacterium]|nr:DNA polymerase III subunit gamma/tau [Coriobacteriales bacterium]